VRSEELRDHLESLLASRGFDLVEASTSHHRGTTLVTVVVHRPQGVSLADCESVARLARRHPSLAPLLDEADLEVCSPGVDRKIKDPREYGIFKGRGIKILRRSGGDWLRGTIQQLEGGSLTVANPSGAVSLPVADIKRAFLDDTQEVRS
jgi:ribosome maturation factor RimP